MRIFTTLFHLNCTIVFLFSTSTRARSQLLPHAFCPNTTTYNPNGNSTYRDNLSFLLSTLSIASRTHYFYNYTAGLKSSHVAYGLFMCRGDVTNDACESCVKTSAGEILSRCSDRKAATIWDDNCMLRYSNQSIFSLLDRNDSHVLYNAQNGSTTDLARFSDVLVSILIQIATEADGRSEKKFAVQERNHSQDLRFYTLAQCTPDLLRNDCHTCLSDARKRLSLCCHGMLGARVLSPSCNIRYETYKFYNSIADAPSPAPLQNDVPPSPPPPPPPKNDFPASPPPPRPKNNVRLSPPPPPPKNDFPASPPPPRPKNNISRSPPPPPPKNISRSPPPPPQKNNISRSPPPPPPKNNISRSPPPPPPKNDFPASPPPPPPKNDFPASPSPPPQNDFPASPPPPPPNEFPASPPPPPPRNDVPPFPPPPPPEQNDVTPPPPMQNVTYPPPATTPTPASSKG